MGRVWFLASGCALALLSGCFHNVEVGTGKDDEALPIEPIDDAGSEVIPNQDGSATTDAGGTEGGTLAEAGTPDSPDADLPNDDGGPGVAHDAGPEDAGPDDGGPRDAGTGRIFHWVENGPEWSAEEGPVSFALTCVDQFGGVGDCTFRCREDQRLEVPCAEVFSIAWARAGTQAEPLDHTFCVTVEPTNKGPFGLDVGSATCHQWTSLPHTRPYLWVPQTPATDSTELTLEWPLRCAQAALNGEPGEPREDCSFRCSVDGIPYRYAGFPTDCHFQGLAPGEHVLRVETTGPSHLPLGAVSRVTTLTFTIEPNALPSVVSESVSLPPLLSTAELAEEGVGALLEPYGLFAATCARRPMQDAPLYAEQLRAYLSYALSAPDTKVSPDEVETCFSALTSSPAPCRPVPGVPETYLKDGPLDVRLPTACLDIVEGRGAGGDACLTNAECDGFCDRGKPFEEAPRGYCADDFSEFREGIMCRTRGCTENLYCDSGFCRHVLAPSETCEPVRAGVDCPKGYTCSGGAAPRCIKAAAALGDSCRFDKDCGVGSCSDSLKVCVERAFDT